MMDVDSGAKGMDHPCTGPVLISSDMVARLFGRTLVLVPHPDDETLGCGGLLALLAQSGMEVYVVLVSDGSASHPHSISHSRERLQALRLKELHAALRELGFSACPLTTLSLPDGAVPLRGQHGHHDALEHLVGIVQGFRPDTVVMPWRWDEHADHRATQAFGEAACKYAAPCARQLQYAIWPPTVPGATQSIDDHVTIWQIDVSSVVGHKRRALAQHASQLGLVVMDDAEGFMLPTSLIEACERQFETYYCCTPREPPVDSVQDCNAASPECGPRDAR